MSGYGLTERQRAALDFITARLRAGKCPTFDEIKVALGLRSKSGVHRLVSALVDRGHLVRLEGRARALALPGDLTTTLPTTDRMDVLRIAHRGLQTCPTAALREIVEVLSRETPKARASQHL